MYFSLSDTVKRIEQFWKCAIEMLYIIIGPLLDDWLKGGTPKALKGLPSVITLVSVCLSVCLYVCLSVIKLQVTVFDPAT